MFTHHHLLSLTGTVFGWDIDLPLPPFFEISLATNILVTGLTGDPLRYIVQAALNAFPPQLGGFGGSTARTACT
jgi:hypothetical protein